MNDLENLNADNFTLEEIQQLQKILATAESKQIQERKKKDLEQVRKLCKLHGFTATDLRGYLKTRKKAANKSTNSEPKKAAK